MKKVIIGTLVLGAFGYFGFQLYQFAKFTDNLNECGFSYGPCYGEKVELDFKKIKVDNYLYCPNGKIGFVNTQDSLAPIVFKIDQDEKLLWSLKLESDSCSEIPLKKMSGIKMEENKGPRIEFFNETYMEPGTIYLTKDYDFDYLCLSPM